MFRKEINTTKRNLIFFRYMIANEPYHYYMSIDGLFSLMKDDLSESGVNNTLEDLRILFNKYKSTYGKYPSGLTEDLSELLQAALYPNLTFNDLENYFKIQIEGWDKDVIEDLLIPRLEYLYLTQLIAKSFQDAKRFDPTDYAKRSEALKTTLWKGLVERELKDQEWMNEIFQDHLFEFDDRQVIPSSFSTINRFLSQTGEPADGGYTLGGLYSFLAQPKAGKTTVLANEAAGLALRGHNVAVASFEISVSEYHERIMCNLFGIERKEWSSQYTKPEFKSSLEDQKKLIAERTGVEIGNVFIRAFTNANTQKDVLNWVLNIEKTEGKKIDVVIVDYINIITDAKAGKGGDNTYLKIKSIAEDLRGYGRTHKWVTLTATQVNRAGTFTEELDLTHVSESAGLSATVDGMIGIISVKNIPNQRKLQCVLSRKSGSKEIVPVHMDWNRWSIVEFSSNQAAVKAFNQITNN